MNSKEIVLDIINKGGVIRLGDVNEPHLRAVAAELGVTIRKKGCQTCINEAFYTIREVLLFNSTKINTNMSIDNYDLVKHKAFESRVGRMSLIDPLLGKEGHSQRFDFNSNKEVLFDIWKYNPTGYREFFEFVPIVKIIEEHNERAELLDGVELESEPEVKPKKKKKESK